MATGCATVSLCSVSFDRLPGYFPAPSVACDWSMILHVTFTSLSTAFRFAWFDWSMIRRDTYLSALYTLTVPFAFRCFVSIPQMIRHIVATFMIIGFCLYCALAVPGVGMVWSIAGSSVS